MVKDIAKTLSKKLSPMLTATCDISVATAGSFNAIYTDIPCRVDSAGAPTINPDSTVRDTITNHNVYIPKSYLDDTGQLREINPTRVRRIWVTSSSIEDRIRDLRVKQLISSSDSGVLCFLCESSNFRSV